MTGESDDEAGIIAAARGGDERAFETLVSRHRDRVFTVAVLTLRDRDLADEITQDVFVRLFRALPSFRQDASLATWLHRVAVNACIDLLRSRRRRPMMPMTQEVEERPARSRDIESEHSLRRAVGKLEPDLRAAVSLRYGAGFSYAEIAAALAWPLGTVCTRLHRALKTLHEDLAPGGQNP